ncbi:N-formylglutamate amidohydrolase [Mesonia aquimarina]|uniref:N-formylglutamate amidohydrolase n=1 Tax=Mesonia aquimarina TaxID=1504967 RepID=UPI000EF5B4B4|nr:N-formylglutamate amidohydrolase [Mesonia aquimarina]
MKLIITCEHGGNLIPSKYIHLFKNAQQILASHQGFDTGTLDLFTYLSPLADFSKATQISRLLIEVNRSLHHPQLFSAYTKSLSTLEKNKIIDLFYQDYRRVVEEKIKDYHAAKECVFHLSLHSFTPILNKENRTNDIGILYDSKIEEEKSIAKLFKSALKALQPDLIIRFNYPYLGSADGFTTYLRKKFPKNYIGIELEINQNLVQNNSFPILLKENIKKVLEKIN